MSRRAFFVLVALIGLAPAARAADIQVSYRVDAKVLKKSTPAGTSLTFQLYTDNTCATSTGGPQTANVEAVTLIEQPKLIKVKGGPRPPSVAEIRYTMTGITPQPAFYAKVTGGGITAVGGACQLQLASVGHVPRAVVKDSNGSVLGAFLSGTSSAGNVFGNTDLVLIEVGPSVCPLFLNPQTPAWLYGANSSNGGGVYYPGSGCSGDPLLSPGFSVASSCEIGLGQIAYLPPPPSAAAPTPVLSYASQGYTSGNCASSGGSFSAPDTCCIADSNSRFVGPPSASRDLSGFLAPYKVELQ